MTVALTEERLEELNRQADMARAYGVEIENTIAPGELPQATAMLPEHYNQPCIQALQN